MHDLCFPLIFLNKAKERWNSKKTELTTLFTTTAQAQFTELSDNAKVNFDRWQILGTYVWPNAAGYQNRTTYESECQYLTDWMQKRIDWMDSAVSGL